MQYHCKQDGHKVVAGSHERCNGHFAEITHALAIIAPSRFASSKKMESVHEKNSRNKGKHKGVVIYDKIDVYEYASTPAVDCYERIP